jgi:hypothetical protein
VQSALTIRDAMPSGGLFADKEWRVAPEPFVIDAELHAEFEKLGPRLRKFYRAGDRLYRLSVAGSQPGWIAERLDAGKPQDLIQIARDPRIENEIPRVIRPDILLTEDGWKITELDSVPGGIGLTAWLQHAYLTRGTTARPLIVEAFAEAFRPPEGVTAIVVSEEAAVYRPEMDWLADQLGPKWRVCAPDELEYEGSDVLLEGARVGLIYRFFELFDLANIRNADKLFHSSAIVSAPPKPVLEEKMLLALFWHEALEPFWKTELGDEDFLALRKVIPQTWIVEPGARDWNAIKLASQKKRRLVLKLSGFSELAWGGRSLKIGHDLSTEDWSEAIDHALESLPKAPYVMQPFEKGRRVHIDWFDFEKQELVPMDGRVRLCPFYFGENSSLGGILATICPPDKKIIHGMRDAVMTLAVAV